MIGQNSEYSLLIGQDALREEAGAGGQETGAKQEKQEEILPQTGSKSRTAKRGVTTATATSWGGFTTTAAQRVKTTTTQRVPATTSTADA